MVRLLHPITHVAGNLWAGNSLPALPCREELLAWPARGAGGGGGQPVTAASLQDHRPGQACPPPAPGDWWEHWHGRVPASGLPCHPAGCHPAMCPGTPSPSSPQQDGFAARFWEKNPIPSAVQQRRADPGVTPSSPLRLPAPAPGREMPRGAPLLQAPPRPSPRARRDESGRILRRMRRELETLPLSRSNLSSSAQDCTGSLHPVCDARRGEGLISNFRVSQPACV